MFIYQCLLSQNGFRCQSADEYSDGCFASIHITQGTDGTSLPDAFVLGTPITLTGKGGTFPSWG